MQKNIQDIISKEKKQSYSLENLDVFSLATILLINREKRRKKYQAYSLFTLFLCLTSLYLVFPYSIIIADTIRNLIASITISVNNDMLLLLASTMATSQGIILVYIINMLVVSWFYLKLKSFKF